MALTTASSKLRSTILFNSKDEQVLFKRSSADLAAARGLTPSALLARLPMEQLTSSDLGRWAAQLIYAEDGSCLDAFEGMFEDWSAIQPDNECRDVIKGFFDYCHEARICIDTTSERVHHLRTNWDSICLIMEEAAKMPECNLDARIQAKTGRELETTLQDPTALLAVTPLVSYILNAWEHIKDYSCTYRALLDFANIGRSSRKGYSEPAEARISLLHLIDEYEKKGAN